MTRLTVKVAIQLKIHFFLNTTLCLLRNIFVYQSIWLNIAEYFYFERHHYKRFKSCRNSVFAT